MPKDNGIRERTAGELLFGRANAPRVPCHTCGGNGFYWREDPAGELGKYPVKCNDCPAFGTLRAANRMAIARWSNDTRRRIADREKKKNPRWFDELPGEGAKK